MKRRSWAIAGVLMLLMMPCGRAWASTSAALTIKGIEQPGDSGTITISFNGHAETVAYGQYSSAASLASAFGAMFTRDYYNSGLSAKAGANQNQDLTVVTFRLTNGSSFGPVTVTGSTASFQVDQSAWAPPIAPSSVALQCAPSAMIAGDSTSCRASVSSSATGTITFSLDGATLSPVSLNGGSASNTLSIVGVGNHSVGAVYSGDSTHAQASASTSVAVNSPASLSSNQVYSFSVKDASGNSGYAANGNVVAYTDSVNGTWSNLGYDSLNRLTGGAQAPVGGGAQYFCWTYDSFGNRTLQSSSSAPYSGGSGTCQTSAVPTTYAASYNGNNRVVQTPFSTPAYDAAGNITSDDHNQYLYDDDGRVCAVNGTPAIAGLANMVQYVYDAEGRRVAKGTITTFNCDMTTNGFSLTASYVLGQGGEQVTEMNGQGQWVHTNVFAGGQLMATYDPDGTHFQITDWLGSRRVQADYLGRVESTYQNLPFGEFVPIASPQLGATEHHFTGKERDSESGLDYFGARYYASNMGRWMSPDWADKPEAVPYSDLSNPQSLNLYGYVLNNPLGHADADGHCCDWSALSDYAVGVLRGGTASLSGGRVGAPSSSDSMSSLAGQTFGTMAVGAVGAITTDAGIGAIGTGLAAAGPTSGVSLSVSAVGVGAVAVGSAATAGAVVNTGAIADAMGQGSYTNTHESGKTYSGKGDQARSQASGKRVEQETGDKHTATDHTPAASDRGAFKDESRRIDANGGAGSNANHNKIESPGKNYRKQDGSQ